jgi:hypothetical protein
MLVAPIFLQGETGGNPGGYAKLLGCGSFQPIEHDQFQFAPRLASRIDVPRVSAMKPCLLNQFVRMLLLAVAAVFAGSLPAAAKIQFDVFAGYGTARTGHVRTGGWFPIGFELMNDGPSFDAVVEVSSGQLSGQTLRIPVELPTNTRKRLVVPAFSTASSLLLVDARLFDGAGKVRAEAPQLRLNPVTWEMPMLGALPAAHAGRPALPTDRQGRADLQPMVTALQPEFFPDNPIALEGLNALYLNSQRALELKEPQANALLAWVFSGGHLIVAVDQPADFNSAPWLQGILPAEATGVENRTAGDTLFQWTAMSDFRPRHAFEPPTTGLETHGGDSRRPRDDSGDDAQDPYRRLQMDTVFSGAELPVVTLRNRDGRWFVGDPKNPLAVTAGRGRGLVTLLGVNPEREPFKSWKLRPWFFAKLVGVSPALLRDDELNLWGGQGIDSVFGAMIETKQIRKLPVGFLLLLLLVYLVVIGPFDRWWLKKINRPMLTWITFPGYVALFSLLIYFIGFKLRSGQREWNELHVVDVIPQAGGQAALRGHSFASIYSPANDSYRLLAQSPFAGVRAEFGRLTGASLDSGRVSVRVKATEVEADIFVPVWTSQLNVVEWLDFDSPPLSVTAAPDGKRGTVRVANQSQHRFEAVWIVDERGYLHRYGELAAGASVDRDLRRTDDGRVPIQNYVIERNPEFQIAVSRRGEAFGSNERAHIDDWPGAALALSFASYLSLNNGESRDFIYPNGFDLTGLVRRGEIVVLAWMPNESVLPPLNQFEVTHQKKGTLFRLVVPAQ